MKPYAGYGTDDTSGKRAGQGLFVPNTLHIPLLFLARSENMQYALRMSESSLTLVPDVSDDAPDDDLTPELRAIVEAEIARRDAKLVRTKKARKAARQAKKAAARPPLDLPDLLGQWLRWLSGERKSPATLQTYQAGVQQYIDFCEREGLPVMIERRQVSAFMEDLLYARGVQASTGVIRLQAVRRFTAWLVAEGELDVDPTHGMKPPKVDRKLVPTLTLEQMQAMTAACVGPDFIDKRDEALVRFMFETGTRATETATILLDDVDRDKGVVLIRGKGGKHREVTYDSKTGRALDRYIRMRGLHPKARTSPNLWLGGRGHGFAYPGLYDSLKARAEQAGIEDFYPHRMRHTMAGRWLAAGGTEKGLMGRGGWGSRTMVDRYTGADASERSKAEARTLNLGDF